MENLNLVNNLGFVNFIFEHRICNMYAMVSENIRNCRLRSDIIFIKMQYVCTGHAYPCGDIASPQG